MDNEAETLGMRDIEPKGRSGNIKTIARITLIRSKPLFKRRSSQRLNSLFTNRSYHNSRNQGIQKTPAELNHPTHPQVEPEQTFQQLDKSGRATIVIMKKRSDNLLT